MESGQLEKEIKDNLKPIKNCANKCKKGMALLSTYKTSRYPHFYPRDAAAIARMLRKVSEKGIEQKACLSILSQTADFLLAIQSKKGHWHQRYDEDGKNRSIYRQEDNNAHGISFLCNYISTAKEQGTEIRNDGKVFQKCMKAFRAAENEFFNKEIGLFRSTTSIHEFGIEKGYTLWTNSSYLNALKLLTESGKILKKKNTEKIEEFANELEKNINKKLFIDGKYVARLFDETLEADERADITLMSPLYFGFVKPAKIKKTISFMRKNLWDKELGLLHRYNSSIGDPYMHNHAGIGPWIQYSAMLAQCYYAMKMKKAGDRVIFSINKYRSSRGFLPEHVSTKHSFEEFWRKEWITGLDYRKEFDEEILHPDINFDKIADEIYLMARSYRKIKTNYRKHKRPYIRFGVPLAWSHAEYIMAILMK